MLNFLQDVCGRLAWDDVSKCFTAQPPIGGPYEYHLIPEVYNALNKTHKLLTRATKNKVELIPFLQNADAYFAPGRPLHKKRAELYRRLVDLCNEYVRINQMDGKKLSDINSMTAVNHASYAVLVLTLPLRTT